MFSKLSGGKQPWVWFRGVGSISGITDAMPIACPEAVAAEHHLSRGHWPLLRVSPSVLLLVLLGLLAAIYLAWPI